MDNAEASEKYRLADEALRAGRHSDALKLIRELEQSFPGHPRVLLALAYIYKALGRRTAAIETCEKVCASHGDGQARRLLDSLLEEARQANRQRLPMALQFMKEKNASAASYLLEEMRQSCPDDGEVALTLARAYRQAGETAKAVRVCEDVAYGAQFSGADQTAARQLIDDIQSAKAERNTVPVAKPAKPPTSEGSPAIRDLDMYDESTLAFKGATAIQSGLERLAAGDIAGARTEFFYAVACGDAGIKKHPPDTGLLRIVKSQAWMGLAQTHIREDHRRAAIKCVKEALAAGGLAPVSSSGFRENSEVEQATDLIRELRKKR